MHADQDEADLDDGEDPNPDDVDDSDDPELARISHHYLNFCWREG
jgi:hypothetical protein